MTGTTRLSLIALAAVIGAVIALALPVPKFAQAATGSPPRAACVCPGAATPTANDMQTFLTRT